MTTEAELATLRQRFSEILMSENCSRITFRYDGTHFRSGGYSVIAMSLATAPAHARGRGTHRPMGVTVARMPEHVGAQYDAEDNEIRVPNAAYGTTLTERMAVVHEATHAVLDYYRMRVARLDEEAIAYIAGAMYIVTQDRSFAARSEIGQISMEIAREITGATRMLRPWTDTVTNEQRDRLRAAIMRSPTYRNLRRRPRMHYPHDGGRI